MALLQVHSHEDQHEILRLEIQFIKDKLRQVHAELSILRRSIALFVERFDARLQRDIRQRQNLKESIRRLFQHIQQSIQTFLEAQDDWPVQGAEKQVVRRKTQAKTEIQQQNFSQWSVILAQHAAVKPCLLSPTE